MTTEDTKRCPFCGEEILAVAIKCKHCASNLTGAVSLATVVPPGATVSTADFGWALLGVPLGGTMLLWFWVTSLSMIQGPGSATMLIVVGVVIITATLAAIEAGKLGMKANKADGSYSPAQWMFMCVFLWVVGYPAYLFKRRHYGRSNLIAWGIMIALVFIGSAVGIGKLIDDKNAEFQTQLNKLKDIQQTFAAPTPFARDPAYQKDSVAPTSTPEATSIPVPGPRPLAAQRVSAGWTVHLGSFASKADAETFMRQLKTEGFNVYLSPLGTAAAKRYRVRLGPIVDQSTAAGIITKLQAYRHAATLIPPNE